MVLLNSNPATIMTDTHIADHVYIEPITIDTVCKIMEKEKPDGIIATLGGQVGLNMALALDREGGFGEIWGAPAGYTSGGDCPGGRSGAF